MLVNKNKIDQIIKFLGLSRSKMIIMDVIMIYDNIKNTTVIICNANIYIIISKRIYICNYLKIKK